jgi:hypothetical protein
MSLSFYFNDPCPKCGKPTVKAVIEAHPSHRDLALYNFHCAGCGPIKTKIISLELPVQSSDVATA